MVKSCLSIIAASVLTLAGSGGARADSVGLVACPLGSGQAGLVFHDMPFVVTAPVVFDHVNADSAAVWVMQEFLENNTLLGFGKPAASDGQAGDSPIPLEFLNEGGGTIYSCQITIQPFDVETQGLAALQYGTCNYEIVSGPPQLTVGATQVVRLPEMMVDYAASPVRVLDPLAQSNREVALRGRGEGTGVFVWFTEKANGRSAVSTCPIQVKGAGG